MAKQTAKKKNPILLDFAKRVRARRYQLDITQEELSERAGFHVNFVGGLERGERNPSLTSLVALAKALNYSVAELVSGD